MFCFEVRQHDNGINNNSGSLQVKKPLFGRKKLFFFILSYAGERPWWPIRWEKEESEKLRGERDQINFIHLGFERWQVVRFSKSRRQDVSLSFMFKG